jgi:hypothetical protein
MVFFHSDNVTVLEIFRDFRDCCDAVLISEDGVTVDFRHGNTSLSRYAGYLVSFCCRKK